MQVNNSLIICFNINTIQICLELNYVQKAILLPAIKPVPQSPDYLIGLINMAGESIFIIDLALGLGMTREVPYSLNTPILLCKKNTKMMGMVVDKILGLKTVSKENFQLADNSNLTNSLFKATVMINQKNTLLVDIDKIFAMVFPSTESLLLKKKMNYENK